jgi:hypothetical protein
MKASDIEVGREYAYSRFSGRYTRRLSAKRVKVIARADVPDGATIHKQDDNANVVIVSLSEDGSEWQGPSWQSPYQFVSSRWIRRTWEEEAARIAAAKAAQADAERAREERIAREAAAREDWAYESAEFIAAAKAAGITTDYKDLRVNTTYADGSGSNTVTLSREAVRAITKAIRAAKEVAA